MNVCFTIDNFLTDQDKSGWMVDLSDGTRVYCDDNRPGLNPNSWHRLRDYLYNNNLYITNLFLRFRSEVRLIGSSTEGYFLRRGIMADIATGENSQRFVVGLIQNNKINIQKWNVPEMILFEAESELRDLDGNEDGIIWNTPINQETNVVQHNL